MVMKHLDTETILKDCDMAENLARMEAAIGVFRENLKAKFSSEGEW